MNQNFVTSLAQPTNHVAQAFEARTTQLDTRRKEEQALEAETQRQRDNDMLKVFEFAGDGRVNEAKYYAQAKGLQVPEEIYGNADFAKGLTLAGKIYGDDPIAAQKFTTAWMSNPNGDLQTRLQAAQQAAGAPIDPNDREYQRKIAFELWKQKNIPEKPPVSRFEAGQDAFNEVMGSGLSDAKTAEQARLDAQKYWDQEFNAAPGVSPGLMGGGDIDLPGFGSAPASVRSNNPGNMRPVGATTGFQSFDSPQAGMQAMKNDLAAKISGNSSAMQAKFGPGYSPTLANVIATWAPPDDNNTAQYVMYVSQQTGIGPNQVLTLPDIERIMPAMIQMEGGQQAAGYYATAGGGQQPAPSSGGHGNANLYSEAMLAISSGANPEAVYNRLKQMGVDPTPIMQR